MENRIETENETNITIEGSNNKNSQKMTIIPTIDISKGRAVLVCQGKVVVDNGDPMEKAQFLSINSDFQVVDLDRAMEIGDNSEVINKICKKYPCYVAGGIRNFEIASEFLNNNAKRIVIGTGLNKKFLKQIPKNRMIVAFDVDEKLNLYKRGRKELSTENIFDKIEEYGEYISFITVTFHYTEGRGEGTDLEKIVLIQNYIREKGYKIRLAVAGGINSLKQISDLIKIGIIPQFGHGLWKNIFTLGDIYSSIMDYDKMDNYHRFKENNKPVIFPCAILGTDGKFLGLTYTDSHGIKESVDSRKCVFYSRERQKRWLKGETSGNFQTIKHVGLNCDRSALIYVVDGSDFCHLSEKSCFNFRDPTLGNLLSLENYIKNSLESNRENSYTKKIFENKKLQVCKIFEEANEVWTSTNQENLIHELSDLLYFTILYSISNGIEIKELCKELQKRHFKITKEKFLMNPIPSDIKLGICLNQHCEKIIFEFLETNGIKIIQPEKGNRSLKYEGYLVNHPEIKILPFIIKPKDVHLFLENNLMDAVVSFQDILDNYPANYERIQLDKKENSKKSRICVISKNDFEISEYENNSIKKLRVFSEYVLLTTRWLEKRNIKAKVIPINGSAEGFLHHNLCDVVVCVVDTGRTLVENDLKIIDTIYESEIGIFARREVASLIQSLLKLNFE
jgi:phosphoribosyl-ATP pyrophosphohydrolase/phosphoribosyl-AMP cyclohydrolase